MESRSSYHPYAETGKVKAYKWCVRLVLEGEFISRGITGMLSKKDAKEWLDYHVAAINSGKIYAGSKIKEAVVYYANGGQK